MNRHRDERIDWPTAGDWAWFCQSAKQEGWRVPTGEPALYSRLAGGRALVLRRGDQPVGLVTLLLHEHSGWIGNLLVAPAWRGQGCGGRLFRQALQLARQAGIRRLWLTASRQGQPLYQRLGFEPVAAMLRWQGRGLAQPQAAALPAPAANDGQPLTQLLAADRQIWGEDRQKLLAALAPTGLLVQQPANPLTSAQLALLQPVAAGVWLLGPWLNSGAPTSAPQQLEPLLTAARQRLPGSALLLADLVQPAPALCAELARCGQLTQGVNILMGHNVAGLPAAGLIALASLGSCG